MKASGTSPKDAHPLMFVSGDQAYEVEVEIEADGTASAGLLLFYSERLFAVIGFSAEKMLEYWRGDITTFDKPAAISRRFSCVCATTTTW